MRRRLALALFLCAISSAHAFADPPSVPAKQPSEIERLEQVLGRAQDAKTQGELKPDHYEQFLIHFRASLEQAWGLSPRTPADSAAYARIQARLGDTAQALAALGPALQQDPHNADLRLTFGEVNFEKKDYTAALAEANAVLERDPGNKRALALKRFSVGRGSGVAAEGQSPLQFTDGASALSDPRVVEAGRRATARQNALHFTDKAMTRLRLNDSSEALRYSVLAEASDPTLADAHMQQGLAYIGLKQPGQAYGRFTRAEELWQAKGNEQAAMARTMKERAAAQMAAQPKAEEPKPTPAPDSRRTTWPLGGAAAGLLLAGMGASLLKHDEEREQRWRKPILVASLVGIGVLGGGLLGYAAYAMAAPALTAGGGTLALAGGGTMSVAAVGEGAVLATAVGGLAGGAAGAKAAEGVESESSKREPTSPNGAPGRDPGPGPLPIPVPLPIGSDTRPGDCSLNGGEDILLRFVDGTRLAPGFIKIHDQHGGHTEDRHIAKPVEYLLGRLAEVPRASSFNDMNTAERYIKANAEANKGRIEAWWRRGGPPESFTYAGSGVVGYGVAMINRQPAPQQGGRIVLTRMNDCRILILTAYPE